MSVALEFKNDSMRRGGFSPAQWVLGRHPRRPGALGDEEEWGQLGVLQSQQDGSTEFGRSAAMRFTVRRHLFAKTVGEDTQPQCFVKRGMWTRNTAKATWLCTIATKDRSRLDLMGQGQLASLDSKVT